MSTHIQAQSSMVDDHMRLAQNEKSHSLNFVCLHAQLCNLKVKTQEIYRSRKYFRAHFSHTDRDRAYKEQTDGRDGGNAGMDVPEAPRAMTEAPNGRATR